MRRIFVGLVALIAVLAIAFFTTLASIADRRMNRVVDDSAAAPNAAADSLHRTLRVVDLHADALLWPRDLLDRHSYGHVDLPRLQDGGVALQVFSVVTKTPRGINYERNSDKTDNITLLAAAERYPLRAWTSLYARALHQAGRLKDAAQRSNGQLQVVTNGDELTRFLDARSARPRTVAGILATEGLHPLEGRLDYVDSLLAAGYRIFGLTHFFDNELGGSAHGEVKGGLTAFGRDVIRRLDSLSMVIDVAHASPAVVDDVLQLSTRAVIVSHTGVQAVCPGPRNLSDDQLRRIAAKGGIVGIGFWDGAVCAPSLKNTARAIAHAVQVAGEDHVALGSDFDGSTTEPIDATGYPRLTQALLEAGLTAPQVTKVMGENALRLLATILPAR